jgi:transcriptional regulator with XRE-family HTH domain
MNSLLNYRRDQGLTQAQLAEKLGISQGFLSQLENNARTPSLDLALRIENLLGYRPPWRMNPRFAHILEQIRPPQPRRRRFSLDVHPPT